MTDKEILKKIFSSNLKKYMKAHGKSRTDICNDLGYSYFTVSDWVNGKKYPRMDKIEKLANYFGILISDLIEEKSEEHKEMQEKNSTITNIIVRLRTDEDFLSLVDKLNKLDGDKIAGVNQMLSALLK